MNCLVIYDIPSDRVRNKVADVCMDYGLNRIQFSAFSGDLLRTHQEELSQKARRLLGKNEGKVYLYCVGEHEWAERLEVIVEPAKQDTDKAPGDAPGDTPGEKPAETPSEGKAT